MLRTIVAAGTLLVAVPILAQTKPGPARPTPEAATSTPQPPAAADPAAPDTVEVKPADAAPAAEPAPDTNAATPSTPAPSTSRPAPTPTPPDDMTAQAAQPALADVVESEFPSYDRDGDGKLSRAEFAAWMVALKARADPSTRADAPATRQWLAGAFASADKDRSAGVTEAELTGFLTQGRS